MALTTDDVRRIAAYARIALTENELAEMTAYMSEAIKLFEPIRAYDLAGVEPTYHPIGGLSNVMAADVANKHGRSLSVDAALSNAASTQGKAFRIPSILGTAGGDQR
jgi:aspartyl-tRNA(Asn)/glutamyl-tRNA(Gln) amidotransferase subunit C